MKLSTNTKHFHNELGLKKTIDILATAGFEAIDFNADLPEYHTDAHDAEFYREVRTYAAERGIVFTQTHAPFATSFADEEQTKRRFGEIVTSFRNSALLGAEMVVVHPCNHISCRDADGMKRLFSYNLEFYKKLQPYAESCGIKIAIENGKDFITEKADDILLLLKELDSKVFTVCFDVGHANIGGEAPADMIRRLGKHIGCLHIHDNDGILDMHTLPYQGNVDWENVMRALAESDCNANLSYEAGKFVINTPVALRAESARYMAEIGRHLIGRYDYYKQNEQKCKKNVK